MSKPEDKYGFLPNVAEHIVESTMKEVEDFILYIKHVLMRLSAQFKLKSIGLKKMDFLGKAIEVAVDSALDLYNENYPIKTG